ncbi:MAG: class I SAM-dependent methyltransferase [Methylococcales bacterium]
MKEKFSIRDGIVRFQISRPVTKAVTEFYDVAPFPNYRDNDNKATILERGNRNPLSRRLKQFMGFNRSFLEVGSGTSQLSNYLAIGTNNEVFAFDPTLTSLKLGHEFARKNDIPNVTFVNADVFDDVFADQVFDVAWCSGVLHHTKDPAGGFDLICKYVKKDGIVIVGLYNWYGRLRTQIRRFFYKFLGVRYLMLFDPVLRKADENSGEKIKAWIRDQYIHPVESCHSFDEVLGWFERNNIEFINSIPSCEIKLEGEGDLFKKAGVSTKYERVWQQILMIFSSLGGEGGLFIFVGRKR